MALKYKVDISPSSQLRNNVKQHVNSNRSIPDDIVYRQMMQCMLHTLIHSLMRQTVVQYPTIQSGLISQLSAARGGQGLCHPNKWQNSQ